MLSILQEDANHFSPKFYFERYLVLRKGGGGSARRALSELLFQVLRELVVGTLVPFPRNLTPQPRLYLSREDSIQESKEMGFCHDRQIAELVPERRSFQHFRDPARKLYGHVFMVLRSRLVAVPDHRALRAGKGSSRAIGDQLEFREFSLGIAETLNKAKILSRF